MPVGVSRLDRQVVKGTDHVGLRDAVGQHVLPVDDLRRVGETGVQAPPGDAEQELVAVGHNVQQRAELQVSGQVGLVDRQRGAGVEVAVGVHQAGFHDARRSFSCG